MSAKTLERLFEPFRQADNSTARKYGGTGLGLVICKALVEKLGGSLCVTSVEGKGSRFFFDLPLPTDAPRTGLAGATDVARIAPNGVMAVASTRITAQALSSLRILLVDDQPINRLLARNQLKQLGCAPPDEAESGLSALEFLRHEVYDVVLMDMQMPEMDGLEATRQLRLIPLPAQPAVIAMTANAFAEDRDACMAAGMNHFLSKPVKLETLREALAFVMPKIQPN
jgi:CheY-like chemotaxis protein